MQFEIFADDFFIKNDFLGIGCLFVPTYLKSELVNSLTNLRCLGESKNFSWEFEDCNRSQDCDSEHHKLNNTEIHYRHLSRSSSHPKKVISKNWVDFLIENNLNDRGLIYFKILYINLSNLDEDFFGDDGARENIYNRFFRTLIKGSRLFFGNSEKEIKKIYHHVNESHEIHPYFPWHTGYRLNLDENDFSVMNKDINFVKSDHRSYLNDNMELVEAAQLIQFIDLIIGVVSRNIFDLSNDPIKVSLATMIRPLVKRLLKNPNNNNSQFNYFKKQAIDFFPKNKKKYKTLFGDIIEVSEEDNFYTPNKLARLPIRPNSRLFDQWQR